MRLRRPPHPTPWMTTLQDFQAALFARNAGAGREDGTPGWRASRTAMTKPESALCGALLLACAAAWAQPAPLPSASASAAEKAQKETDRTMYWIRVLADKPSPTKAAAPPKPAVAAVAPAARPV